MNLSATSRYVVGSILLSVMQVGVSQEFPTKPLRFVVANTPGSPPDLVARILAPDMSKVLGQPVIVENKPGAGQRIGLEYVAKQVPADGHTIASVVVPTLAILPLTVKELRFDPLKDLLPFIEFAEGKLVLGSSSRLPWKNFQELVSYAKQNPGKLNYGASGQNVRLPVESLIQKFGIDIRYVPYNAATPYYQALVAADVQLGLLAESTAVSFGEKFRVLGVTGERRSATLPDVPTFAELGHPLPGLTYSVNAPAGVPRPAVAKLYASASHALKQPGVRNALEKQQLEIVDRPPEVAVKHLAEVGKFLAEVAKKVGITKE